jgi:hypothetical protein
MEMRKATKTDIIFMRISVAAMPLIATWIWPRPRMTRESFVRDWSIQLVDTFTPWKFRGDESILGKRPLWSEQAN